MKYPAKQMLHCFIALLFFIACTEQEKTKPKVTQTETLQEAIKPQPCDGILDTSIDLHFKEDTSTADYYQLLEFIESSSPYSRFNRKHQMDSFTCTGFDLIKILCMNHYTDTRERRYALNNIFAISYILYSSKPLKKDKHTFPRIELMQLNFISEKEKQMALEKIEEVGWGNPYRKFNYYILVPSKTRIIVLMTNATDFMEATEAFSKMLEKEWTKKFNY
jgi:hypothetical protein